MRAGEVLDVQYGDEKTQMRVIWVGKRMTPNAGEIGVQQLPGGPDLGVGPSPL